MRKQAPADKNVIENLRPAMVQHAEPGPARLLSVLLRSLYDSRDAFS